MEKVLIIDDSIFGIEMLNNILKTEYQILTSQSGENGIAKAEQEQPSLILLDINMPVMSGFEVIIELRKNRKTCDIPVIFLTGIDDPQMEEKAFFLGAEDYITKPYHANVVLARVRTHVDMFCYRRMIETQLFLDPLTGLYNRKHFEKHFLEQWHKMQDEKGLLTIGVVDIDHFKEINDSFGHQEGDTVLRLLSGAMKSALPGQNAYIARVGGEEFVILLSVFSREEAELLMEHVRDFVARKFSSLNTYYSHPAKDVTVSIGCVSVIPQSNTDRSKILESADQMLYVSKKSGRNRVSWQEQHRE